jgi:hypothetical protein
MLVLHLAAQTRTPPHYLLAKMANLAGDALLVAERGLGFKVRRKQRGSKDSLGSRRCGSRSSSAVSRATTREEGRDARRRDDLADDGQTARSRSSSTPR